MKYQYDCPRCGTEFEAEDGMERGGVPQQVQCECCKSLIAISPDYEFRDGMWRDLTTISVVQRG
jgi:DNA-directed RNA polymerase subunit RPC12/RpoP